MQPMYADFTVDPPRLGGASLGTGVGPTGGAERFAVNHLILGAGESVVLEFPDGAVTEEYATLGLTVQSSMAGASHGHAPLTVTLNGHEIVSELIIPGGGNARQLVYAIPAQWFSPEGPNTLTVANGEGARTFLWLYLATLVDASNPGAAKRDTVAAPARESVLTYRTLTRSPDGSQTAEGPALRLYLGRGGRALPSQLSWTAADGTHSAISFQSAMDKFGGVFRYAHGEPVTLHGHLTAQAEYDPEDEPAGTRRFAVECNGDDAGSGSAAPLLILLDDGRNGDVAHLAWRDQAGDSASISFTQNRSGFVGYYQRHGEGPIAMRGSLIGGATGEAPASPAAAPAPRQTDEPAGTALADELIEDLGEIGRQVLTIAEDLTGRLTSWLRDRTK